jgi:hypothetical protein
MLTVPPFDVGFRYRHQEMRPIVRRATAAMPNFAGSRPPRKTIPQEDRKVIARPGLDEGDLAILPDKSGIRRPTPGRGIDRGFLGYSLTQPAGGS